MRDPGRRPAIAARHADLEPVLEALRSCSTEADIVQVLYQALRPRFGYEVVALLVLEQDGWYHAGAVDQGILQDVVRRNLLGTQLGPHFEAGRSAVIYPSGSASSSSRGPGAHQTPRTVIFVPCGPADQPVGAVLYQTYAYREVPAEELAFLEETHRDLGVLVRNAYLNELTRNQSVRLSALNETARELALTHDEAGVAEALGQSLRRMVPVDELRVILLDPDPAYFRVLRHGRRPGRSTRVRRRSRGLAVAARVMMSGETSLSPDPERKYASGAWAPIREGEGVSGVLAILCQRPEAYEESTLTFLEQVANEASLALRNVASFAELEAQRRRLEVVNAVGRRLASSLDRVSIMRTLREELERHLEFDGFALATILARPDGPIAEGYQHMRGSGEAAYTVPLAAAGPSREAYQTGRPVLVRRSPWARRMESADPATGVVHGDGAVFYLPDERQQGRLAMRSIVWVPVRHGSDIVALLSLQSYRADAFDTWHVRLLEDVAAHVSLALANADHFAAAQTERRRLEALHVLELAVAGSADERGICEAVVSAARDYITADSFRVVYLETDGLLAGFWSDAQGTIRPVPGRRVEDTVFFHRLQQTGTTLVEHVDDAVRAGKDWDSTPPVEVVWVPVLHEDRVVAGLSAQRHSAEPFDLNDVALLESAAPVVGIALRTVRLHRANELALAHSLRVQEVAALAGHELAQVVDSVAEQARDMLGAAGAACWTFAGEGRAGLSSVSGAAAAGNVLEWSSSAAPAGRDGTRLLTGETGGIGWTLLPLWVASRLVGALGAVHSGGRPEDPAAAAVDFARHAAIAIENARLVDALAGERRTLDVILQHSPVGMILEDADGRVVYANAEVRDLYGAGDQSMEGRKVDEVLAAAGATVERDPESASLVARMQSPERTVEIRRVPVAGSAEHAAGILSVHEDVTRERQALEAKDLMLRAIGHEVRSPAAAMKTTLAGILQWNRVMDAEQREALLTEAYEMSDRLLSLVEGQLIISRLETRRFEPNPVPVALATALEHVLNVLRHRYGDRVKRISVHLPPELPRALCESTHLDQVLTNLVGNALEYTDAPVTVSAQRVPGGWLEVTVRDSGQGLSPERVATLFRKTGAGQSRARGGLGLGLYLCSLVVEQSFGGRIWLAGTGRDGTTFKFTVPALEPAASPATTP